MFDKFGSLAVIMKHAHNILVNIESCQGMATLADINMHIIASKGTSGGTATGHLLFHCDSRMIRFVINARSPLRPAMIPGRVERERATFLCANCPCDQRNCFPLASLSSYLQHVANHAPESHLSMWRRTCASCQPLWYVPRSCAAHIFSQMWLYLHRLCVLSSVACSGSFIHMW